MSKKEKKQKQLQHRSRNKTEKGDEDSGESDDEFPQRPQDNSQEPHERIIELNLLLARIHKEEQEQELSQQRPDQTRRLKTIPLHFDLFTVAAPFSSSLCADDLFSCEELRWWPVAVEHEREREERATAASNLREGKRLEWLPKCRLASSLSIFAKKFAIDSLRECNNTNWRSTNALLTLFSESLDEKSIEREQLQQKQSQHLYHQHHYPLHFLAIGSVSDHLFNTSESLFSSAQEIHKKQQQEHQTTTDESVVTEDREIGMLFYEWAKGMYRKGELFYELEHFNGSFSAFRRASRLFQKCLSFFHGRAVTQRFSMISVTDASSSSPSHGYPDTLNEKLRAEKSWFEMIVHGFVLWGKSLERMTYLCPTDSNIRIYVEDYLYSWKNHSMRIIVEGFGTSNNKNEDLMAQQMLQPVKALCFLQNRYVKRVYAERVIAHLIPFQGTAIGREASRTLATVAALKESTQIEPLLTTTQKMLISSLETIVFQDSKSNRFRKLLLENSEVISSLFTRRIPFYFSCHFMPYYPLLYSSNLNSTLLGVDIKKALRIFNRNPIENFGRLYEVLRNEGEEEDDYSSIVYITEKKDDSSSVVILKVIRNFDAKIQLALSELLLIRSYHSDGNDNLTDFSVGKPTSRTPQEKGDDSDGDDEEDDDDDGDDDDDDDGEDAVETDKSVEGKPKEEFNELFARYYGSYLWKGELWIAMEYGDGGSLLDLLSLAVLTQGEVAFICKSILLVLVHLHKKNRACRDLNAKNVLISREGDVFYGDTGLSSKLLNHGTSYFRREFMPPELLLPQRYSADTSIDIWSLGCLVIQMVTGNKPFHQYDPFESWLLIATQKQLPFLPPSGRKKQDSALRDFVALCLLPDPKLRPRANALLSHPFMKKAVTKPKFAHSVNQKRPQIPSTWV